MHTMRRFRAAAQTEHATANVYDTWQMVRSARRLRAATPHIAHAIRPYMQHRAGLASLAALARLFGAAGLALLLEARVVRFGEQRLTRRDDLVERAAKLFASFVLSSELARYEEHSDTEAVAGDVLVMSV